MVRFLIFVILAVLFFLIFSTLVMYGWNIALVPQGLKPLTFGQAAWLNLLFGTLAGHSKIDLSKMGRS